MQIVLDQPLLMGVHVPWESQMEYYISHNDWDEVSKLLDLVPASVLSDGILQIALDGLQPALTVECNSEFSDCGNYICSIEELDVVCMDVPDVKIFRLSSDVMCSTWLRMLMEQELAKKFIFLKEYWEGTAEIVNLLARAGFITQEYNVPLEEDLIKGSSGLNFLESDERFHVNTIHALHKLVVQHCAQYNLPNLLDLYLDHHKLVLDNDSLCSLEDSAVSFLLSCECLVPYSIFFPYLLKFWCHLLNMLTLIVRLEERKMLFDIQMVPYTCI